MKRLNTIEEVVEFVKYKHRSIKKQGNGVYGYVFSKEANGTRQILQEIRGMKLFDFHIDNNTDLIINQLAVGTVFKGKTKHTLSSTLFLRRLTMINLYDHCAQFYTDETSAIDFAYVEDEYTSHMEHLMEFCRNKPGIMRAQWLEKPGELDRLLEENSLGRSIERRVEVPRNIDMHLEEY